ncbi:phosphate/phosphite/phosphonate ABC transporter substrate-binding protein [Candidatus Symbiobacter mobilis]|uniref:ABC-type transporter component n=1 Tax=Candidatus Symbiobacter mobilis CR TaxID=946483 RepID=U5NBL0_9BURK|nr:phosphate/phosphite/phosphonate ABC transporter substrate-binding protein [Candidatus Symbiobacter mobilis]AGX87564.1 ABC-type transporter component [Candidatus Symbiobacter mobilis CR]
MQCSVSVLRWLCLGVFWAASLALAQPSQPFQPPQPFRVGVAPHSSARAILEMYQPLRKYLEQALGQPVEIVTATDFGEFARRMLKQDYDIAITTGHQARLAQTDAQYIPLLTYAAEFRAVTVVANDDAVKAVADLRGKPVLGLSPASLVTLWGEHWLRVNEVAVDLRYISASDSVARLVLEGQAVAGFLSMANYQSLPRAMQARLRFLVVGEPMAGRVYMLNHRNTKRAEEIRQALEGFAQTPAARDYFAKYKLEGYRPLRSGELEAMDLYTAAVRQSLR